MSTFAPHARTAPAELRARSLRGGAITLLSQTIKFLLHGSSIIILARLLAPEDFGLVAMLTAVTGFLSIFKDLGLSTATIQRKDLSQEQVSTLFWVNVLVGFILTASLLVSAPLIARFYGRPELLQITAAISPIFLMTSLGIQHQALLKRNMEFGTIARIEISGLASGFLVGVLLAKAGFGYWALVAMQITTPAIATLMIWFCTSWRPGAPGSISNAKSLLTFGGNVTGFNAANYLSRNIDNVLIGKYWGAQQLGFYNNAYQLLLLPLSQINAPILAVCLPMLSRLVDEPQRYRTAFTKAVQLSSCLILPVILFLLISSEVLIPLVLGNRWLPSVPIFQALAVLGFVQPLGQFTGVLFTSQNRTDELLRWGLIGAVLSTAAIIVGLPWGALGVAVCYAASGLFIRIPLLIWYAGRHGSVSAGALIGCLAPFLLPVLTSAAIGYTWMAYTEAASPIWQVSALMLIILTVFPASLAITKQGRDVLNTAITSASHLFGKK